MTIDLIDRLRTHAAYLASKRVAGTDDEAPAERPSQMEADLLAASTALAGVDSVDSLRRELSAAQSLLHQAISELQKHREWAQQIRGALGAYPGGEL